MAENPPWAKLALQLDGAGGAEPFTLGERLPERREPVWVHLDYTADDAYQWLLAQPSIPDAVAEALVTPDTRPRAAEVGGGLLVYLRGVNLYPDARPEDMIAIRLWLKDNLIISTQKRQLFTVNEISDNLLKGEGPASGSELLAWLVDGLTWRMEDVIERLEDLVGQCSDALEHSPDRALTHAISGVRRRAIALRRYLAPQREAISRLQGDARLDRDDAEMVREAGDRLTRLVEDLDAARDQATLLQEEVFSVQNEAINDRMYLLAIISAIFLPLGFLTGLFGINIGGMPGVEDPNAFWWFLGFLGVISVFLLLWMVRQRWFGDRASKAVRLGRLGVLTRTSWLLRKK
ncbi:CorA family divalent cation transporter [Alloalcanivorax marinus]|uniref:CorA family divalent cation transporter n=1 Tax=Alloalcanivorax marinus TaxID=1177169 RepID=UPI0019319179|nr:zinc transporter ZntB [Alloalcanivorax marinus]